MNALNSVEFIRNLTADKFWRKIEPDKVAQIAIEAAFRTDRTFQARDRKSQICWKREWRTCISDRSDISNSWSQESEPLEERVKKLHFGHIRTFQTLDRKNRACWERERNKLHFGQIGHSKLVITRIGPVGRERVKKLHFGQIGHSNWTCWKTDRQTEIQKCEGIKFGRRNGSPAGQHLGFRIDCFQEVTKLVIEGRLRSLKCIWQLWGSD